MSLTENTNKEVKDYCRKFDMKTLKKLTEYWRSQDAYLWDTETTGLENDDEIIEIGIINMRGHTIYSSKFRPNKQMSSEVMRVHGYSMDDLEGMPSFQNVSADIQSVMEGRMMIAWNAVFDARMLRQTIKSFETLRMPLFTEICAKKAYGDFHDLYNAEKGYHRNCSLQKVAEKLGIQVKQTHNAVDDCLLMLDVLNTW